MYLGLDCGTSGLKALLTDESGEPVASATRSYSPDRPRAGWSEQNPDDWANAMAGAIADLRNTAGNALSAVKAVGFSGQMHGAVLFDRADRPIGPQFSITTDALFARRTSSPATIPISPGSSG